MWDYAHVYEEHIAKPGLLSTAGFFARNTGVPFVIAEQGRTIPSQNECVRLYKLFDIVDFIALSVI